MKNNKRLKAFLLYDVEDILHAQKLYKDLYNDGFDVWFDQESLLPGHDKQIENEKALSDSDVVIICLSPIDVHQS